jgi:hypothetical protein
MRCSSVPQLTASRSPILKIYTRICRRWCALASGESSHSAGEARYLDDLIFARAPGRRRDLPTSSTRSWRIRASPRC